MDKYNRCIVDQQQMYISIPLQRINYHAHPQLIQVEALEVAAISVKNSRHKPLCNDWGRDTHPSVLSKSVSIISFKINLTMDNKRKGILLQTCYCVISQTVSQASSVRGAPSTWQVPSRDYSITFQQEPRSLGIRKNKHRKMCQRGSPGTLKRKELS